MPQPLNPFTTSRRAVGRGTVGAAPAPATLILGALLWVAMPGTVVHAAEEPAADPMSLALEPLLAAEFAVQSGRLDDAARW